jgi:hypothetical protein
MLNNIECECECEGVFETFFESIICPHAQVFHHTMID